MHKLIRRPTSLFFNYVKLLLFTFIVLGTLGVAAAATSILFSRPIGDDYGSIATFHSSGHWLKEAFISVTTTGRYSQSITASTLYGGLGNRIVTVLPLITLAWFLTLTYFYTKKVTLFFTSDDFKVRSTAIILSVVITFLVLFINDAPATNNLPAWISFQLFFWSSGIITYTIPFLLLMTVIYLLFASRFRETLSERTKMILLTLTILFTSLYNETHPMIIISSATGLLGISFIKYYGALKKYRKLFVIAIITGIISIVALYFSPGRMMRSQFLSTIEPTAQGSLLDSILRNIGTFSSEYYFRPREIVLLTTIGLVMAFIVNRLIVDKKKVARLAKAVLPYSLLLIIFCAISTLVSIVLVAIGYGYAAGIYPRTMLFTQVSYVLAIPLIVCIVSLLLIKATGINRYITPGLLVITGILFLISLPHYTGKLLAQVNSSVLYANAWDKQDAIIRHAAKNNKKEVVYLDNPARGIGDGFSLTCTGPYAKSTMWLNVQVWEYYGRLEEKICEKPSPEDTRQ